MNQFLVTNTFQKHMTAVKQRLVTRTNVIGIRKALNARARIESGLTVSSTCPTVVSEALDDLTNMLAIQRPRVCDELYQSGCKLLQDRRNRRKVEAVAEQVKHIHHFNLVGYMSMGSRMLYHIPMYEAVSENGKSFVFYNVPWQSGGNGPELISYE